MLTQQSQLAFVLSTLTVFVVYWMNGQHQERNLPPGHKKYPLIGSLFSSTLEWETFAKWGQEYSPWWIETDFQYLQYSSNDLCRFRYSSCQRIRDIGNYLKLVQRRHRPSRPKIQYLLQQARVSTLFSGDSSFLQLDHTPRIVSSLYRTLKTI